MSKVVYNSDAEVRIAQGCFVLANGTHYKPIALHLYVDSPASYHADGSPATGFSTVGSVDGAGLFA